VADPVLANGQYSIDGLVFGRNTDLLVAQTQIDQATITNGDQPHAGRDGMRFGVDYITAGKIFTFTGTAYTDPTDSIGSQDSYARLESAWLNSNIRLKSGAVSCLRFKYPNSPLTRRVYGRGRQIAPTLGSVSQGATGFVAAFQASDDKVYSDTVDSIQIKLGPTDLGTPQNQIPNPGFEDGTTGWTTTGGTLTQDQTHVHGGLYAGKFVPNGSTANPSILSPQSPAAASNGTVGTIWLYAPSALSKTLTVGISFYNSSGGLISTLSGSAFTLTAGSWQSISLPESSPAGTVTALVRVTYTGTPVVGDILWLDDSSIAVRNGGLTWPVTWPAAWAGLSSTEQAVNNQGVYDTWPVIVFNGPITNGKVSFPELGTSFMLQGPVASGVAVSVDTQPWASTIVDQNGNSYAGYAVGNSLGDLAIPPGQSRVIFTGQDPTNTSSCQISWRSATATIGGTTI
jgi:hypothetical protein